MDKTNFAKVELIENKGERPYVFLQWKGTDVCLDFNCDCGFDGHFDGYGAYAIACSNCGAIYEMPSTIVPRKVESTYYRAIFILDGS